MAADNTSQKRDADVVENVEYAEGKADIVDAAVRGQATTGYETLTIWETVKTFKVATFFCFAAAFSAATDGYQIG
jgi:hypothetical protein